MSLQYCAFQTKVLSSSHKTPVLQFLWCSQWRVFALPRIMHSISSLQTLVRFQRWSWIRHILPIQRWYSVNQFLRNGIFCHRLFQFKTCQMPTNWGSLSLQTLHSEAFAPEKDRLVPVSEVHWPSLQVTRTAKTWRGLQLMSLRRTLSKWLTLL
jgi:hypothetical protein